MNRIKVLFVLLLLACSSPKPEEIISTWANGSTKELRLYKSQEEMQGPNYLERIYYENGSLQSEGYYSNNRKSGEWKSLYATGKLKSVSQYLDGEQMGPAIDYYQNGQLKSSIDYQQSKPHGLFLSYDSLGNLLTIGKYVYGYQEGIWFEVGNDSYSWSFFYYSNDGNELISGMVEPTRPDRLIWRKSYPSGTIAESGILENNHWENSRNIEYLQELTLTELEADIKSLGTPVGLWKYYYDNGNPLKEVEFSGPHRKLINYWYESGNQAVKNGRGTIIADSNFTSVSYPGMRFLEGARNY